jgi:protein gp37
MNASKYWDKAWSCVDGCTPCSPGCDNCWSMALNKRFHRWPEKVIPSEDRLNIPLKTRKPTVFALWNDLFHEDVPSDFIYEVFNSLVGRHTYLLLTKRARRMRDFFHLTEDYDSKDWPNVYLGLTVCNQQEVDEKIPIFLQVPGKKFLSIEPMLGPIDLKNIDPLPGELHDDVFLSLDCLTGHMKGPDDILDTKINAVICGCETGPKRRPCQWEWIESIINQCKTAGVPCFVKQVEVGGKIVHELEQFPECLRVRELPWRNNA